ncbi:methionine aminotransferase [Rubrolithibacter danxiaensis]|uniref:methionine aminotransferase n=1 Tax=Rubrolithibacter danxiaensis TaxID=3390805 RepID=UPI003BF7898D
MINLTSKLPKTATTIFTVMSQLAEKSNAINLSQGFPDFDCDPQLIDLVDRFMREGKNQYAPMAGLPALQEIVADKVNVAHQSDYIAASDVTITAGGTQALFTAMAAIIQSNDEVVIFDPSYDSYAATIRLLGGIVKPFELNPPDYKIDWSMLKKLITVNTRMIIVNSPKNPTGTIIKEEDIKELISITRGTDIIILSDEVYEHLIYDDKPHLSMAKYPELRERSFICASFGKLLHNTGWKLGYCIAPSFLMKEFRKVHQFNVFSVNTPMQYAIAEFLKDTTYYQHITSFYQQKRDFFRDLMKETKFNLLPCEGSYFQTVSYADISEENDTDFCKRLTKEFGIAPIPVSAFYTKGTDFGVIRFCFAKKQETLERAIERLMRV